ncbi:hypothetical protein GGQ64_003122 [Rhizobium azooxidifex]|uniref:VCBS repeat-containing protein n=1 Tax=Mycoplana azooxidifex TaxID=1636188 RepID=A0A7W6DDR2_9HYPH|nr:hypothetical protein [Mycoplana azooxidifex]MBB3977908.1 hypothetical protein [Mycoplana azooxidifex]
MTKTALPLALAVLLPAAAALADDFPADRITAAAVGDWDRNGAQDLAVIASPPEGSDDDNGVYIYLTEGGLSRLSLKVSAPNRIWGSTTVYGQEAGVAALANGSIELTSRNSTIGRDRWEQRVTIAYRSSQFVVAGYTYSGHDTLDPNHTESCDLNVLTGKGTANGKPVATKGAQVTFEAWRDEMGQKACRMKQE